MWGKGGQIRHCSILSLNLGSNVATHKRRQMAGRWNGNGPVIFVVYSINGARDKGRRDGTIHLRRIIRTGGIVAKDNGGSIAGAFV